VYALDAAANAIGKSFTAIDSPRAMAVCACCGWLAQHTAARPRRFSKLMLRLLRAGDASR